MRRRIVSTALVGLALLFGSLTFAGGDWNEDGVAWMSYEDGLAAAKESGKPICLVFFTDWCPHCVNFAKLFHNSAVIEKSSEFVMIRLNKEAYPKLSSRYAPDGQYIPRTYFLTSAGKLDPTLHAPRDKYKFFYHESRPESILGGMTRALEKIGRKATD